MDEVSRRGRAGFHQREYLLFVAPEKIKHLYDETIGRVIGSKSNPLWHVTITCSGASELAHIYLGMDGSIEADKTMQSALRDASRKYLGRHFELGEGMRCWFALRGNPRIDVWLKRQGGAMGVEFNNSEVISLILYWCNRAGCALY